MTAPDLRWVGALVALALPASAETLVAPNPLSLAWCQERAATHNPQIAADGADAEAARHRVPAAGSLDDPRLGYEASNVPIGEWDFGTTPLSGHQLRIAQRLPFPGLRKSRAAAAGAAADAADAMLDDRRRRVAAQVESAWTELGFVQHALRITDDNLEILRQLVRMAEVKYRVGSGLQEDVLRAHVELTSLLQQRLAREQALAEAEARLTALLDLEPTIRLPVVADFDEAAPIPELAPLLDRLQSASPRLRAAAARVAEADDAQRAARLEGYPDFDLSLGYRIRERVTGDPAKGRDFVGAGVTIRLPVNRTRWRSRVAEEEAKLRRARAQERGERAQLRDQLRGAHAALRRADAEGVLLRTGLVPQARQSLESSRAGYEVGRVDFPGVADAQVELLEAELRLARAAADRRQAFASLEAALGEELR